MSIGPIINLFNSNNNIEIPLLNQFNTKSHINIYPYFTIYINLVSFIKLKPLVLDILSAGIGQKNVNKKKLFLDMIF